MSNFGAKSEWITIGLAPFFLLKKIEVVGSGGNDPICLRR